MRILNVLGICSFLISGCQLQGVLTGADVHLSGSPSPTPILSPTPIVSVTPFPSATPIPNANCSGSTRFLSKNDGTDIFYRDVAPLNWQPGDTIVIPSGVYGLIELGNIQGTASCPITIKNGGGLVTASLMRIGIRSQHVRLMGIGDPLIPYGFKVVGVGGVGLSVYAADIEIAYMEFTNQDVGILVKKDPVLGDLMTQYPTFVLDKIYIHHNYVHGTNGEGMYIGGTAPSADPYYYNLIPQRLNHVEIAYNIVANTGWDGIQLSNAREGAKIHHNSVTNYGIANISGQRAGIILGSNTTGSVYSNTVKQGTGNGIQAFGYGPIEIYNNAIENTGEQSIYSNDYVTTPEVQAPQEMKIHNNTIRNTAVITAIQVNMYHNHSLPSTVQNNGISIPHAAGDLPMKFIPCPINQVPCSTTLFQSTTGNYWLP